VANGRTRERALSSARRAGDSYGVSISTFWVRESRNGSRIFSAAFNKRQQPSKRTAIPCNSQFE